MSYLQQYARLPASIRRRTATARVDERTLLNLPEFDGGAHIRCFVEDTSAARKHRDARIKLRITDCTNQIHLEFSLGSDEARENALYKANTLIAALHRFRDALAEEAELAARRARKEA